MRWDFAGATLWDVGSANLSRPVHGSIANRTQPMAPIAKPIASSMNHQSNAAAITYAAAILRHSDVSFAATVAQQIGRRSRPKGNLWRVHAKNRVSRSVPGARKL